MVDLGFRVTIRKFYCVLTIITYRKCELRAADGLLRVIVPLDTDHPIVGRRLPERFDFTDIRTIRTTRRQEHRTIANLTHGNKNKMGTLKLVFVWIIISADLPKSSPFHAGSP